MNVVVVDVVVVTNCTSFIDDKGTHITVCNCKNGGIGEINRC